MFQTNSQRKKKKKQNIHIKLITKYVDDLFAIIKNKDEEKILTTFNSYHNKLKFTIEKEEENAIPYLDMKIYKKGRNLITNWYKKPIASGRLMNFHSNQPMQQKINTATNFVEKIFKLSDNQFMEDNIIKIKDILSKNNFPKQLINTLIRKGTNKTLSRDRDKNITSGNPKFYSLPFIPKLTERNKIKEIIKDEEITIAYKPNKTISNLFTQTKTKIDNREKSNVVYEIKCDGKSNEACGKVYIGTTKRSLGTRIDEHKADITKMKQSTALAQHCIESGHIPNFERVRILDKERKESKRYTLESLRIQEKSKLAINTKEDIDNTNASYTIILT